MVHLTANQITFTVSYFGMRLFLVSIPFLDHSLMLSFPSCLNMDPAKFKAQKMFFLGVPVVMLLFGGHFATFLDSILFSFQNEYLQLSILINLSK